MFPLTFVVTLNVKKVFCLLMSYRDSDGAGTSVEGTILMVMF